MVGVEVVVTVGSRVEYILTIASKLVNTAPHTSIDLTLLPSKVVPQTDVQF